MEKLIETDRPVDQMWQSLVNIALREAPPKDVAAARHLYYAGVVAALDLLAKIADAGTDGDAMLDNVWKELGEYKDEQEAATRQNGDGK